MARGHRFLVFFYLIAGALLILLVVLDLNELDSESKHKANRALTIGTLIGIVAGTSVMIALIHRSRREIDNTRSTVHHNKAPAVSLIVLLLGVSAVVRNSLGEVLVIGYFAFLAAAAFAFGVIGLAHWAYEMVSERRRT